MNYLCKDPFNKEDFLFLDTEVNFCIRRFIRFTLYHIIFYLFIGPLLGLIFILAGKKYLAYNMGFYGNNRGFYT